MAQKMTTNLVVGDADSIIAQVNPQDSNHPKATKTARKLIKRNIKLVYPATAIAEAITVIQRVLNSGATAYGTAVEFAQSGQVTEVDPETFRLAVDKYFSSKGSKQNTLFDCLVAATADKLKADAVFSFDKFYKKQGFRLASDL